MFVELVPMVNLNLKKNVVQIVQSILSKFQKKAYIHTKIIVKDVVAGIKSNNYKIIVDRGEAIKEAVLNSEDNAIILVAGKGHENYQILKNETIHFDDRETAGELLREINNVNI